MQRAGIQDVSLASNPRLLQTIAGKLEDWKPLARYLELDDPTIKEIEYNNYKDFREQKYQALKIWTERKSKNATLYNLLWVIVCDLENELLIEKIAEIQRKGT